MQRVRSYLKRFESIIYTRLGGLDMAEEFFRLHPEVKLWMRGAALMHRAKGAWASSGAAVFYQRHIQPLLRKDREDARRF